MKIFTEEELLNWHKQSSCNMDALMEAGKCGCFHCKGTFEFDDINETYDDKNGVTPVCPICLVDATLPETDPDLLNAMHDRWFRRTTSLLEILRKQKEKKNGK